MRERDPDGAQAATSWGELSAGERAIDGLLRDSHLASAHELPDLVTRHARVLGATDSVVHLVDLQGLTLVPLLAPGAARDEHPALPVDGTLAGLAFQRSDILSQQDPSSSQGDLRLWLPLIDGTDRLGVLGLDIDESLARADPLLRVRLWRFAALVAEVVVTKSAYGDSIARARRSAPMGLAAEVQWSVLPPLTFACREVVVAGALEPAYEVAGDSLDYAVDSGVARFAAFDGMGHGLRSAQLSALTVAAYRHARRAGQSLVDTARLIDDTVEATESGASFVTAVLAELDTGNGQLSWVNAGHPAPLLLRQGRIIKELQVTPGLPFGLGLAPEPGPYPLGTERLQPGDQVLLYTDGVIEARSPQGEFFGIERLIDLIARHEAAALSLPETMRRIMRALLEHQQGRLDDDASLLLVQYRGGGQGRLLPDEVAEPPYA